MLQYNTGILYQQPVVLASIYTPNWDDHSFFNSVLSLIPNLDSHTLILGGDLNCVIDPVLDRSSPRIIPPSKMSQTFQLSWTSLVILIPEDSRTHLPTSIPFSCTPIVLFHILTTSCWTKTSSLHSFPCNIYP